MLVVGFVVCAAAARCVSIGMAQAPSRWVNVKEYAASGSKFETTASTTAGSKQIVVKDVGDFGVGQGVMVSKCHPHYTKAYLRGPGSFYSKPVPLDGVAELRGFDGSGGDWLVFVLDTDGDKPLSFRWSDDLALTWKGKGVPITWDWQKLSGGLEIKFLKRDLQLGHGVTFSARTQLVTAVEKIDGKTLWLRDAPTKSVTNALVQHCEAEALQAAINRAISERKHVYFPNGHYRLEHGLVVRNAAIRIEGASGVHTLLDISNGEGAVFGLYSGREVTIRNFRMVGHTGYDDKAGTMRNATNNPFWCCALKPCQAVTIHNTERVLCENVHASRMSAEAFYCQGSSRIAPDKGPAVCTKLLTFLRCSVTDCAANAFNNNDTSENTCVLYCRIDGAAWHAYEGPGRFIKLIGNYVRNAGPFTVGDMNHRYKPLLKLGCGQAVIANNVFEGIGRCGGIAINHGATQVTIANNLFINYRGNAITVSSYTTRRSYPSQQAVVSGNIIDLTSVGDKPHSRTGIHVTSSDVIVSDNQIYVRGKVDPRTTGIHVGEPAINVNVHGNIVRNCGHGITARRCESSVREVFDDGSFLEGRLPLEWPNGHRYRGWSLAWLGGQKPGSLCTIEEFDAETCRFKLAGGQQVRVGDRFGIFPASANWMIHNNTITSCMRPVTLDVYGSPTSVFRDNLITRGQAIGVKQAIAVVGEFKLIRNHISGFDEPQCAALALHPCRVGRSLRNVYRNNVFERCSQPVQESRRGLWAASLTEGNLFVHCQNAPQAHGGSASGQALAPTLIESPQEPVLRAPKLRAPAKIDGTVDEWQWQDKARVAVLDRDHEGMPVAGTSGRVCAAHDGTSLYLAMQFTVPKGNKLLPKAAGWGRADGVEVSFRSADPKHPTPIFLLWGTAGGDFEAGPYGGASAEQVGRLEKATAYAARKTSEGWACEWRIPFAAMGLPPKGVRKLKFNVGAHHPAEECWLAWVATGGPLYLVDQAGDLTLAR